MITFQEVILRLQEYWNKQGCALLQPIDIEVGAGTSHTATFLRALGPEPWRAAYVKRLILPVQVTEKVFCSLRQLPDRVQIHDFTAGRLNCGILFCKQL